MLKARITVLVSGGGTNLQALIDAQKSGGLQHFLTKGWNSPQIAYAE